MSARVDKLVQCGEGGTRRRGSPTAAAVLLAALAWLGLPARVQAAPSYRYVAAGSEFSFKVTRAALPARRIGLIALASVDAPMDVPSIYSQQSTQEPLPQWTSAFDSEGAGLTSRGPMPFAAVAVGKPSCQCATSVGDDSQHRVAAIFATRVFHVGDELAKLRALHLRARYGDGLVAYLNGREVARSNLARDRADRIEAQKPHGPEWESFRITLIPGLLRPGANLLAIEVRPSATRESPWIDVELTGGTAVGLVRGPLLQKVTNSSATLMFDTEIAAKARVEWGPSATRGNTVESATGSFAEHHVVELSNLPQSGPVHYSVLVEDTLVHQNQFHTAPAPLDVVRFAVYGDVRGGHRVHQQIVDSIAQEGPDFVLATGDMVLRGSDEGDWQRFFAVISQLAASTPYYPVAGNHDVGRTGDERRRMNEIFALWPGPPDRPEWGHWYSFDVADLHFIMLDSNSYRHNEQLRWLEADLQRARTSGYRAIVATTHAGPYSRGNHRGNRYAVRNYVPLLANAGVRMLFSGHDHLYQRGLVDGLAYIVSGGGGAPLYPVRCGTKRTPACKERDGMLHVASVHHYVMVTVYPDAMLVCAKLADGAPLEPCVRYPLLSNSH